MWQLLSSCRHCYSFGIHGGFMQGKMFLRARLLVMGGLLLGALSSNAMASDRLLPNQFLRLGESITSPNGMYTLIMQTDGSLVMYRSNGTVRYRMAKHGTVANLEEDGNFVEYRDSTLIWESGARCGCSGTDAWLQIFDNGDLAVLWLNRSHSMGGSPWGIGPDPEPHGPATSPGVQVLTPPGSRPTTEPGWGVASELPYY
ncbi:hypothetical protein DPH57_15985 [Massilia sp. YMA4]|nr:hypothetical protein DPH57_15985 [Massilia sp. YMA4]